MQAYVYAALAGAVVMVIFGKGNILAKAAIGAIVGVVIVAAL